MAICLSTKQRSSPGCLATSRVWPQARPQGWGGTFYTLELGMAPPWTPPPSLFWYARWYPGVV